jgi:hypothetical protein
LGALGSFFSGSTTVSNLTFGDIQKVGLFDWLVGGEAQRVQAGWCGVQFAGGVALYVFMNTTYSSAALLRLSASLSPAGCW